MSKSSKEYTDDRGTKCPYCDSDNISAGHFEPETFNADVACLDCKKVWTEIYKLVGYEELKND